MLPKAPARTASPPCPTPFVVPRAYLCTLEGKSSSGPPDAYIGRELQLQTKQKLKLMPKPHPSLRRPALYKSHTARADDSVRLKLTCKLNRQTGRAVRQELHNHGTGRRARLGDRKDTGPKQQNSRLPSEIWNNSACKQVS